MKKGKVFYKDFFAGIIQEDENGYSFSYDKEYLNLTSSKAISFSLPLREETYNSKTMFPFFDGLIPEGWLLDIAESNWKINPRDRMSLLLAFCKDCIGAVSVIPFEVGDE
ncbi:MAG: HipA N-terminal domain-containing protein [Ignavibacteriales bacterium]|nr:MAG: HipA N-terminal domain-containing protein [Ignavibacteriales bacterium]